jgi:predicted lipoprotein with Yx(FWY)xxD motif
MSRATRSHLRPVVATLAAIGLLVAACGADDGTADEPGIDDGADDPAASEDTDDDPDAPDVDDATEPDQGTEGDEAPAEVDLAVADSSLGEHLVDGEGLTLYLFTDDSDGESVCTDGCLQAWPALIVEGEPSWGEGVDASLVDTIEREDDGSTQVTYAGMPLYTFASDEAPGDVNGQGSGGVWFVVAPDGNPVTDEVEEGPAY